MREKQKQALQAELGDKVLAKIVVIQRWIRAKILRCRFLHVKRSATTIQVHCTCTQYTLALWTCKVLYTHSQQQCPNRRVVLC